jgi:hypothetical protein
MARKKARDAHANDRLPQEDDTGDSGDYLFDAMAEYWEHVVRIYRQFEDKRPVILYDIQERRIYACPYEGFKSEMSAKTQVSLTEQYEHAIAEDKMVVFVRDNDQKRLVSYLLDYK